MKTLLILMTTMFAIGAYVHADAYGDRREAQRKQYYDQFEQRLNDVQAESQSRVQAMMQAFAARHGGYSEGPTSTSQISYYSRSASYTFSTKDGLACSVWDGCGSRGGATMNCIDANLKNYKFGAQRCSIR